MLPLPGTAGIPFDVDEDIVLHRRKRLPFHTNAMRFAALDEAGRRAERADLLLRRRRLRAGRGRGRAAPASCADQTPVPYPFTTGAGLLAHATATGLPISGIMLANELVRRDAGRGPRRPAADCGP